MTSVPVPFPLSSSPGAQAQEGAGRLINCYAEPLGKDINIKKGMAPPSVVWRRIPGLSLFAVSANATFRGMQLVNNTLYAAWSGKASSFDSLGNETTLTGNLLGTDKVFFSRNNKSPTPDLVCVSPGNGGFIVGSTAVSGWSAAGSPNSVSFMDGYFLLTYGDGTIQASDLNATTITALNKTTAQSKPGGLTRGLPFNGQFYALGPVFGEVYTDTANATGFPFTRSYTLQRGLLGPYAIAGHEDGFGSALLWVADDNSVVQANGTPIPLKVSPPDLDRRIATVTDKTTLEASVYIASGHPKWRISSPTFTWDFDLGSQKWNEVRSYQKTRTRAISGHSAFGKWLVGDTNSSQILYINSAANDDIGDPLEFRLESGPVELFPNRTKVARADFNFVTGVGQVTGLDPIATTPKVAISWSDDGGFNWSNELVRDLGAQTITQRITLLRTGMTGVQGRRWRLRVTAPVYVAFLGATQDTQILRK
jgi:hypothetical protein